MYPKAVYPKKLSASFFWKLKHYRYPRGGTAARSEMTLQASSSVTCRAPLRSTGWKTRVGMRAALLPVLLQLLSRYVKNVVVSK